MSQQTSMHDTIVTTIAQIIDMDDHATVAEVISACAEITATLIISVYGIKPRGEPAQALFDLTEATIGFQKEWVRRNLMEAN